MSPEEFDDLHDESLSGRLGALAPSEFEIDADAALGSLRPAFQRARARRRLAVASSTLGVFAVVVAGAVVLQQQPASHVDIRQRTPTTRSAQTTTPHSTRTTATTQPTAVVPPPNPQPSTITRPGTTNTGTVNQTTPTAPRSTPTTPDDHGGSTPTSGSTLTTVAAPSTKTYTAVGGRATIRFANGALTLVSHTAAAGYSTEIHTNTRDDIELRFSKGNAESRIRVRVQDGRVEPEITEN